MYLYIFGVLVNNSLLKIGSSTGVILSTILCFLPLLILMPIQSKKIIKKLEKESIKN